MKNNAQTLTCANGHLTYVLSWGVPPLGCPHCVAGVPCKLPLNPVRKPRGPKVPAL